MNDKLWYCALCLLFEKKIHFNNNMEGIWGSSYKYTHMQRKGLWEGERDGEGQRQTDVGTLDPISKQKSI